MKNTQTAFAKTLSAITAITLLVACARPCETTEITPARFVERTLAGEFVLVNTIPIYDASGGTITQEVLRTLPLRSLRLARTKTAVAT